MAELTTTIINYLDTYLNSPIIKDYCPNGLQVEGNKQTKTVVTGVTASQALIDKAIQLKADMLLVHHGYFWKGEAPIITGLKKNRISSLIKNDINLVAYHLPLDIHDSVGNNQQLGKLLGFDDIKPIVGQAPEGILFSSKLKQPMSADELELLLTEKLDRKPLKHAVRQQPIQTVAWCTGGGQGYIDQVAELGYDAFITGEVSEQTIHSSREYGIDFFAAGHHATERYGIKALGEHLASKFDLDVTFIDVDNPA